MVAASLSTFLRPAELTDDSIDLRHAASRNDVLIDLPIAALGIWRIFMCASNNRKTFELYLR
ncbi:hypothetical protein [Pseudomonas caricapapayae]|uniref:hypothetical protein n=1 Tax=Pseudomonas caricapapayae TaxID=46678 RepID=UPI000EFFB33B|nr:hypothetical protein [Pseudomonas caricapapayae]